MHACTFAYPAFIIIKLPLFYTATRLPMQRRSEHKGMNALIESMEKYGQTYAIHRSKFGILDGFKREEAAVLLDLDGKPVKKPKEVFHSEIETIDQHLDWQLRHLPLRLTPAEKKKWAKIYARVYAEAGVKPGMITHMVACLLRISNRRARDLLPDEYKDMSQSRSGGKNSAGRFKPKILPRNFRREFDFLSTQEIATIQKLYKRAGKRVIDLCYSIKEHFEHKRRKVDLDPIELEKLKVDFLNQLLKDDAFFQELLGRYEEAYPNKKVVIKDRILAQEAK